MFNISSMSQTIRTLDQNKSHKRATIANVQASTPIKTSEKRYIQSVSLSGIDTASTSSGGGRIIRNLLLQDQVKKRKKYTKGKKRADKKRRIGDSDSEWRTKQKELTNESLNEKRKKNLTNEKKAIKRKRIVTHNQLEDTEWETELEKTTLINERATDSRESILKDDECIKLFEDPCTPEKIRDVPNMYEEILHESPIIQSKRPRLISKKKDVIPRDELLPVNSLSSEVRNLEEISKDEVILHNYEGNESFPTTNLHRQCIRTYNAKKTSGQRLMSAHTQIKLMDSAKMQKLPEPIKRPIKSSIPPGMVCISEYSNRVSRKWKTYIETYSSSEYNSSEKELENGKRKTKTSKRNTRKQKKKMIASQSTQKPRGDVETYSSSEKELENGKRKTKTSKRNTRQQKKKMIASQSTQKQRGDVRDYNIFNDDAGIYKSDGKQMSFREFSYKQKMQKMEKVVEVISSSDA